VSGEDRLMRVWLGVVVVAASLLGFLVGRASVPEDRPMYTQEFEEYYSWCDANPGMTWSVWDGDVLIHNIPCPD
jgi:hypothetical protein